MTGNLKLLSGLKIKSPSAAETRPTTSKIREAVINILGNKVQGSSWLDLCSGSGAIGCEALQKGAAKILAIEKNKKNAYISKSNLLFISQKSNFNSEVNVICQDVITFLKKGSSHSKSNFGKDSNKASNTFDIVYFDPPYKSELYNSTFELLITGKWVNKDSILICEYSKYIEIQISNLWNITKQKSYGISSLLFLTPNQALHYFDDIGSTR